MYWIDVEQSNRLCCCCFLFTVAPVLLSSFLLNVFFKRTTWFSRIKDRHIQSDIHTFKLYCPTATKPHTRSSYSTQLGFLFFYPFLCGIGLLCGVGYTYNALLFSKTATFQKKNRPAKMHTRRKQIILFVWDNLLLKRLASLSFSTPPLPLKRHTSKSSLQPFPHHIPIPQHPILLKVSKIILEWRKKIMKGEDLAKKQIIIIATLILIIIMIFVNNYNDTVAPPPG